MTDLDKPEHMREEEQLILKMLGVLMEVQQLSQRALGERLSEITGTNWTQQKVWKVLNGKMELTVDMLLQLCQAFRMPLVELIVKAQTLKPMPAEVRDYFATMSPAFIIVVSPPTAEPTGKKPPAAPRRERSA